MKTIFKYLKDFLKADFDAPVYLITIVLLSVAFYFNYKYDFEDSILDSYVKEPIGFLYYCIYFGLAYFYVIGIYMLFRRDVPKMYSRAFWLFGLFFIVLLSVKKSFWWGAGWIPKGLPRADVYFYRKLILAAKPVVIYTLGLSIFYVFLDKQKSNWYGLTTPKFEWRPYAYMLLIMLPLIVFAATQSDFLSAYPRLKMSYFQEGYLSYFIAYEPVYLCGFVMVEWLFRGFLVIGMIHLLGHRAILPAATLYCVFHFGKPAGEAIGSFFGGYILGVFAYYSRSIWGGIIVHMGIALLMDLAALFASRL